MYADLVFGIVLQLQISYGKCFSHEILCCLPNITEPNLQYTIQENKCKWQSTVKF